MADQTTVFSLVWRIPNLRELVNKAICSKRCQHRSGLQWQLVALPVGDFWSVYALCSNADHIGENLVTKASWSIRLKTDPASDAVVQSFGCTQFTKDLQSTYHCPGCFNFMKKDELLSNIAKFTDADGAAELSLELIITTETPKLAPSSPQLRSAKRASKRKAEDPDDMSDVIEAGTVFQKGDHVAVCSPEGFWVAVLLGDLRWGVDHKVRVQWFDQAPGSFPGTGLYFLTKFADEIEAKSIHPIHLDVVQKSTDPPRYVLRRNKGLEQLLSRIPVPPDSLFRRAD
eukprot:m.234993 g.234993  ORF g.234993 m.234993 type:complete len:286 (-) comp12749_c0_seq1:175-1032(-)